MRIDIRQELAFKGARAETSGFVPIVLVAVGVPLAIWSFTVLPSAGESKYVEFYLAEGWFVLFAIGYLALHGLRGLGWCSVPVLLTLRALLEYVGMPSWRFATGVDQIDPEYVRAMYLSAAGFTAFWIGSLLSNREAPICFVPLTLRTDKRVATASAAMLGLGFIVKMAMWKFGLYGYSADNDFVQSSYGIMQWIGFLAYLLTAALTVAAIEVLGKRPAHPLMKVVFTLSMALSIGIGIISGSKQELLLPLFMLAIVYVIVRRRIPATALMLPLILVVIYPFVNAYRGNLNAGYRAQATTTEGLSTVLEKSFLDVVASPDSLNEKLSGGTDITTARLNVLSAVHDIVGLPDPSALNGEEKVWMAPFYPLLPRAIWKDKPVLNKPTRLSEALGRGPYTWSAVTPIGDLYMLYGTYGVVIGMFIYGVCLQIIMNMLSGDLSERKLFIYVSLLMGLIDLEVSIVQIEAGMVEGIITVLLTSYLFYGSPSSPKSLRHLTPWRFRRRTAASNT